MHGICRLITNLRLPLAPGFEPTSKKAAKLRVLLFGIRIQHCADSLAQVSRAEG